MNKHYENVHKYDFLTKELLQEEYVGNGLTDKQIAIKYSMPSKVVVWRKRKKFGIENKYKDKSNQNAKKNRKFFIPKEEAEQLIEDGNTFEIIAEKMGCSVVVAKRRFKELGLVKDQKHTAKYKYLEIELNDTQKQLLMGSVLGDGTVTKSGNYSCSHSIKQQDYFEHKRKILNNIHSNRVHKYTHSYDYLKVETESIHFTTGCNKYLYELRKIFYPDGEKIFPYNYLVDNMTEEGLAYWYMDDGSFHCGSCAIHTYGYTYEEQILIQKILKDKFFIKADIKKKNEKWRNPEKRNYLTMNVKNSDDFVALIEPHIIPSMLYKIGAK